MEPGVERRGVIYIVVVDTLCTIQGNTCKCKNIITKGTAYNVWNSF